jgi:hypothetical protein
MDNELILNKNWWNRNWKWFLPTSLILLLLVTGSVMSSVIGGNIIDITQAYADNSLYQNAINKAQINKRVLEILGELEPIDKLAIVEGNAVYSNNNKSVTSSVRLKGSKGNGKMDILAEKNGTVWKYKAITIRIKNPKEDIKIIE